MILPISRCLGENTIEIGKRLIAAKKIVAHGDWQNWLENNFNLSQSTAQRFMNCAERFGNSATLRNLNYSQMVAMLSLPAEETEKFIAEKAAEGNPVEDMKVKQLRDEVAKWKSDYEQKKSEVENLFAKNEKLQEDKNNMALLVKDSTDNVIKMKADVDKLTAEKNNLESQLKNQKPIEKLPDDYEPLKKERDELQGKISQLEKQLQEKPIEVQVPSDYEKTKKELAELKAKLDEFSELAVIVQTRESISQQINGIMYSRSLGKALNYYETNNSIAYDNFVARLGDFTRAVKGE